MDMAKHLNCNPNFDNMEWYEFMSKYEILKDKIKNSKGNMGDFLQGFKNFMSI